MADPRSSPRDSWRTRRIFESSDRAGAFSRAKARRKQRDYLKGHWKGLTGAWLACTAVIWATSLLAPSQFFRGLLVGVVAAGYWGLAWGWIIQVTGTGGALIGADAEEWTAQGLRDGAGPGWHVISHFRLKVWDMDHVLVGPGGVFVLETKWRSEPWDFDKPGRDMRRAVEQVERNAQDLTRWHYLKSIGIGSAFPVVVVWGSWARGLESIGRVGSTPVVPGPMLGDWLDSLPRSGLSRQQVKDLVDNLQHEVELHDSADDEALEAPLSVIEWTARIVAIVVVASAGAISTSVVAKLANNVYLDLVGAAALAAGGVVAIRIRPARAYGWAWASGVIGVVLYAAWLVVYRLWIHK